MNRFHISSPILELQRNAVNNYIQEYVTTVIPFENVTTEQVPEDKTRENNGLIIIIFGFGGILICLFAFTLCYRCIMPDISDEAYARFMRRNREQLRERIRLANLENQTNQTDVENPLNAENTPVDEDVNGAEATSGDDIRLQNQPRTEEGPFSGIIETVSTAIRSHTAPKQLCHSHQDTHRETETHNTTAREERHEHSKFCNSESYVESVPSWEYFPDNLNQDTEANKFCKETMFIDQSSRETGDSSILTSQNSVTVSPDYERRSQSSPTSPDIVRRRYSTQEATPRKSSSLQ